MKSPAVSPPREDTIPNQDNNILITEQDPSLTTIMAKYPHKYKPLFNDTHDPNSTEDDPDDYTDNSRNEKESSVNKIKTLNLVVISIKDLTNIVSIL